MQIPAPVAPAAPAHKPRGAVASMLLGSRYVCTSCRSLVSGRRVNAGSGLVEIVCWLILCFPGLIYSVWRRACKRHICERCGHATLIPESSPAAAQIL